MTSPALKIWLRRCLAPLKWLLALVILFEEWGWVPLQQVLARISRWPGFRWLEGAVQKAPPWLALLLFCLPAVVLLPIKLLALWLIGAGHALTGFTVIVAAKLLGTALVARLFSLTQPALMRLPWFARWYGHWMRWRTQLLAQARASSVWRTAQQLARDGKVRWRSMRRWWRLKFEH